MDNMFGSLPELSEYDFEYAKNFLPTDDFIMDTLCDFYGSIDDTKNKFVNWQPNIEDPEILSEFRVCVHALKSTSKMLGALTLSGLARKAEVSASNGRVDIVKALLPIIIEELEMHKECLSEVFDKENEPLNDIPEDKVRGILSKLLTALENRDYDAMDEYGEILKSASLEEDVKEAVDNTIYSINRLDINDGIFWVKNAINRLS